LHFVESLHPDIWLAHHTECFDREESDREGRATASRHGRPEVFRGWVASKRGAFENEVDREMWVKEPEARGSIRGAPSPTPA